MPTPNRPHGSGRGRTPRAPSRRTLERNARADLAAFETIRHDPYIDRELFLWAASRALFHDDPALAARMAHTAGLLPARPKPEPKPEPMPGTGSDPAV